MPKHNLIHNVTSVKLYLSLTLFLNTLAPSMNLATLELSPPGIPEHGKTRSRLNHIPKLDLSKTIPKPNLIHKLDLSEAVSKCHA